MSILNQYIEHDKLRLHFSNLYQLDIFRTILNVTLSLLIQNRLSFKILAKRFSKNKDGLCATYTKSVYNKILNQAFHYHQHVITIRKLSDNVIIHEIAHAIEKESGLDIKNCFKSAISEDLKYIKCGSTILCNTMNNLMISEVRQYNSRSQLSELFARYFELFTFTKEVSPLGKFSINEVKKLLKHTTTWIENVLELELQKKIVPEVSSFCQSKQTVTHHTFNWQNKLSHTPKPWNKKTKSLFDEFF